MRSTQVAAKNNVTIVRSHWVRFRMAAATVVVVIGFSLSLSACSATGTIAACTKTTGDLVKSSEPISSKDVPSTTLPPSHDNDAGDGRIPDRTPDADVDANQRHHVCKSPK